MPQEHNALKYGTTISRAASRAFGLGDDEPGLSRLGETLGLIADLWALPEWALLRGEQLYSRAPSEVPAGAGRFASLELINATTTKIAVVESIDADQNFQLVRDSGGSVAANQVTSRGVALDARVPPGESSQCTIITGDVAAGIANPNWFVLAVANRPRRATPPFIINPGRKLFAIGFVLATAMNFNVFWREREMFPGERLG